MDNQDNIYSLTLRERNEVSVDMTVDEVCARFARRRPTRTPHKWTESAIKDP